MRWFKSMSPKALVPLLIGVGAVLGLVVWTLLANLPPWFVQAMIAIVLIATPFVPLLLLWVIGDTYFPATTRAAMRFIVDEFRGKEVAIAVTPTMPRASDPPTPPPVTPFPIVNGTVLAWRLNPPKKAVKFLARPATLVVGAALVLLSIFVIATKDHDGLILTVVGAALIRFAFGSKQVAIKMEPLPVDPEGHRALMKALSESPDALEREHIYYGPQADTDRTVPVLVHEKLHQNHSQVTGGTCTGKTARGMAPMTMQLMRMPDLSIVVLTLKDDPAMFNIMKHEAAEAGLPFRYFSLNPREAGYLFNPINSPAFTSLGVSEQAQILSQAMGVVGAGGSQQGFFDAVNERTLTRILERFHAQKWPLSYAAIHKYVMDHGRTELGIIHRDWEFSTHVLAQIEKASHDPRLNWVGTEPVAPEYFANAITPESIVDSPGVLYLNLASLLQPSLGGMSAVIIIRVMLAHLATRSKSLPRVRRVYFMIDEAQCGILEPSMVVAFKQARQYSASFCVAHQDFSDLKRDGFDMTNVVTGNTAVKILTSIKGTGPGSARDYAASTAGVRTRKVISRSQTRAETPTGETLSEGTQSRDEDVPAFGQNEINSLNASALALIEASPSSGYTQFQKGPVVAELPYPFSKEDYDDFEKRGWPEPEPGKSLRAGDVPPPIPLVAPPTTSTPKPASPGAQQPVEPIPSEAPKTPETKRRRPPKPLDPEIDRESQELSDILGNIGKR